MPADEDAATDEDERTGESGVTTSKVSAREEDELSPPPADDETATTADEESGSAELESGVCSALEDRASAEDDDTDTTELDDNAADDTGTIGAATEDESAPCAAELSGTRAAEEDDIFFSRSAQISPP